MEEKDKPWWMTLNGYRISIVDPKTVEALAVSSLMDLKYWSPQALGELWKGLTEMAIDLAKEWQKEAGKAERTSLSRLISRKRKALDHQPKQEHMLLALYETFLCTEGCGLLPRFGFQGTVGNPERARL